MFSAVLVAAFQAEVPAKADKRVVVTMLRSRVFARTGKFHIHRSLDGSQVSACKRARAVGPRSINILDRQMA